MKASRDNDVVQAVRRALSAEPRIDIARHPVAVTVEEGDLVLEGEMPHVRAKRLALSRAAGAAEGAGIIDRLRVAPSSSMTDAEIRDALRRALLGESALAACALRQKAGARSLVVHDPPRASGVIEWSVDDGVITLDGEAPSLEHKRLAGVLAWWVPGSRDVVNGLAVEPPQDDDDDELQDAIRLALEKDPFVDASRIRVSSANAHVTLEGVVPTGAEREMAEADAWYVFGVDEVRNEIEVRPLPGENR